MLGYYHFSTYHESETNVFENVEHGDHFEGVWNFLYFGYKNTNQEASAKGLVWLNQETWRSVDIHAVHTPMVGYAHLLVKREHGHPLFNGQLAHIHFKVGEGAFVSSPEQAQ